ncbi:recombination protein NinG [Massilia sp. X63]|uniref:recombination protein NinG n=1 Tax=Massilia sp. X63 TaxID=3237285 RepID=UPI0034DD1ED6
MTLTRSAPIARASTLKPARTRKCAVKGCPARFQPRSMTHKACSPACAEVVAVAERKRLAAKLAAADRAETRAKLAKFKRRPAYVAEAQEAFNAYIRERDRNLPCICCGSFIAAGEMALHGGGWDAGHYISRGHASHLRFDERNVHKQRKGCNKPGGTTRAKYRAGLVGRYGEQYVADLEALEYAPPTRDLTIEELVRIKETYRVKLRELKREAA